VIFFYLLTISLIMLEPLCVIPRPPKKTQTLMIEKDSLIARQKPFTIQFLFLSQGEFFLYCHEKGLPGKLLASPDIKHRFSKWFSVKCIATNHSVETIYINPKHMIIQNGKEPIGSLVEPGFFLSQNSNSQGDRIQTMSDLFDQTSIEVPAGETRVRVLTFRPVGKMFPRQTVNFAADHIYVGIEKYSLEGRISLKPCSK